MANRRTHKRFIKHCDVEFVSGGTTYTGKSGNFSLRGMFIRTAHVPALGTVLDVLLHLPYGLTSMVQVKVRRIWVPSSGKMVQHMIKTRKTGMGVEITRADANYLHFIRYLLNWNSPVKSLSYGIVEV